MKHRLVPLLAALAILPLAACDGDSPTSPSPQTPRAVFLPAWNGEPESVSVEVAAVQDPNADLTLEIVAHELPAVDLVFFDLLYPADRLEYRFVEHGGFLAATHIGQPNRIPGRLRVHLETDRRADPTIRSGVTLRVFFDAVGPGNGELTFENFGVVDPGASTWRFGALSWFGGSVVIGR